MWTELLSALALVLILEGILPFACPEWLKRALLTASQADNASLRLAGVSCMLLGALLLHLVR